MAMTYLEILVGQMNQALPRHWAGGHLMDGDLEESEESIERRWDKWYAALEVVMTNVAHNQPLNGEAVRYLKSLVGNAAEAGQKVEIHFNDRRSDLGSGRQIGNAVFVVIVDGDIAKIVVTAPV